MKKILLIAGEIAFSFIFFYSLSLILYIIRFQIDAKLILSSIYFGKIVYWTGQITALFLLVKINRQLFPFVSRIMTLIISLTPLALSLFSMININSSILKSKNVSNLIITQNVDTQLIVSEYDIKKNTVSSTKKYPFGFEVHTISADQKGPIMYDKIRNLLYVVVNIGGEGMGNGSPDPPYIDKIMKVDLSKEETPVDVYISENYFNQWVFDPINNFIYLQEYDRHGSMEIVKIDPVNGQKQKISSYLSGKYQNETYLPLVVSDDGKYLFQTVDSLNKPGRELFLNIINLSNGSIDEKKVFTSTGGVWPAETETTISPNGKLLAFFYNGAIYFYDIQGGTVINICSLGQPLSNFRFVWDGGNTGVYTIHKDQLGLCHTSKQVEENLISVSGYFWPETQPKGYVLYQEYTSRTDWKWNLFNTTSNKIQAVWSSNGKDRNSIVGINWK